MDESDQRDLAPGIPLASSPAATTPLMDRLLAARRGDLAPGLPITPAPSSQLAGAAPSGDLDLAPGAPITPAPSQALSSRMPTRAGSLPPAPPPTPAEVSPLWTDCVRRDLDVYMHMFVAIFLFCSVAEANTSLMKQLVWISRRYVLSRLSKPRIWVWIWICANVALAWRGS